MSGACGADLLKCRARAETVVFLSARAILRGFMAVGEELRAFATSAYAGKGRKTFCRTCSAV